MYVERQNVFLVGNVLNLSVIESKTLRCNRYQAEEGLQSGRSLDHFSIPLFERIIETFHRVLTAYKIAPKLKHRHHLTGTVPEQRRDARLGGPALQPLATRPPADMVFRPLPNYLPYLRASSRADTRSAEESNSIPFNISLHKCEELITIEPE